jgi:hypothetical protein
MTNCLSYRCNSSLNYPTISGLKVQTKPKPYALSIGPIFQDVPFCTDPTNIDNLFLAYCKRLSPIMPNPNPFSIEKLKVFVQDFLERNLVPLPRYVSLRKIFVEWLETCHNYTLNRKKQLTKAFNLQDVENFSLPEKAYKINSFVKREFYDEFKNLRFINSRSDLFKARVAGFIKKIEKQFFSLPNFIKYHPITDCPKIIYDKIGQFKYFMTSDYTSFESGFSPEYVDVVECALFRYMLQNNLEILHDLLRCYYQFEPSPSGVIMVKPRNEQLVHLGHNYKARVMGTRMSGEMWTSLGNSFSNLMNILFLCKENNIQVDGIVEGDDGIFGMSDNKLTPEHFEQLGFKIKIAYKNKMSDLTFCGISFNPEELLPIIRPQNTLLYGWTSHGLYINGNDMQQASLLLVKAMSLYCLGKNTPIAGILSSRIIKQIKLKYPGLKPSEVFNTDWWYTQVYKQIVEDKNQDFLPVPVTDLSRQLYCDKYGISLIEQLEIEKLILESDDLIHEVFPYTIYNNMNQGSVY